jgi:hypothetical protein
MSPFRKWLTGIVVGFSVLYKFTELMEFMKPVVVWLDSRIEEDTLVELLLWALIAFLLSLGEAKAHDIEALTKEPSITAPLQAKEPTKEPSAPISTPLPRKRTLNVVGKNGQNSVTQWNGSFIWTWEEGKL